MRQRVGSFGPRQQRAMRAFARRAASAGGGRSSGT